MAQLSKQEEIGLITKLMENDSYFKDYLQNIAEQDGDPFDYILVLGQMEENIKNDFPLFNFTSIGERLDTVDAREDEIKMLLSESNGRLSQMKALKEDLAQAETLNDHLLCELIGLGEAGEEIAHRKFGVGETIRQKMEIGVALSPDDVTWILKNAQF